MVHVFLLLILLQEVPLISFMLFCCFSVMIY
jgi:hypothetical protein